MCGAILKQNIELRNESNKTVSQIGPNGQALELRIQTKRQFQHNFNNLNYPISIIDIVIDFDLNSHFPRIEKFCFELFPFFLLTFSFLFCRRSFFYSFRLCGEFLKCLSGTHTTWTLNISLRFIAKWNMYWRIAYGRK